MTAPGTGALKPFLKWAGGKSSLLPELLPRIPAIFGNYYEPFLGGGAMALAIASVENKFGSMFLNDANRQLINCWRKVISMPDAVADGVAMLDSFDPARYLYDIVRTEYNAALRIESVDQAARFLWLNKHAFNGLYRVNKEGKFNVPWNKRTTAIKSASREHLHAVSKTLGTAGAYFSAVADEKLVLCSAKPGDFVYLDPPYWPMTPTASFTAYQPKGFGKDRQERLAALCRELDTQGVLFMASNNDLPEIHDLYRGFRIESVPVRRPIQAKGNNRVSTEVIICNYP